MPEYLKYLEDPIFRMVGDAGAELGQDTYVVGGYVRDIFLKRRVKDIDFVTLGKGIALARLVAVKLGRGASVNEFGNFGTAAIKWNDYNLEFVGARKESYDRNSRNPAVESGSLKDDLDRRDFTINSMAISLNRNDYGSLFDPHGGMQSIEYGEIRTPLDPARTYSDDPLRMMRAIRFSTQLGFVIEKESFRAIRENRERISIVSGERIADELNKINLASKPSAGFVLLDEAGLLELIFPELSALKGVEIRDGKGHKDNFIHTLQVLDNVAAKSDKLWLRWSAILHDIAKAPTKRFDEKQGWTFHGHDDLGARMVPSIFKSLRLPLDSQMKYVQKMVRLHLRPIALVRDVVTDSAVRRLLFESGEDIDDLMLLCEADITTKNQEKLGHYLTNFKKVRKKLKEVEEKDHMKNWQPPVSGKMIMETFNIGPCREVGTLKNIIRDAILDGVIQNNAEEATSFMIAEGIKLGLKAANEAKLG